MARRESGEKVVVALLVVLHSPFSNLLNSADMELLLNGSIKSEYEKLCKKELKNGVWLMTYISGCPGASFLLVIGPLPNQGTGGELMMNFSASSSGRLMKYCRIMSVLLRTWSTEFI